jgi:Zn-dependent protease
MSLAFGGPGFGWGKPVPVDGRRLRGGRRGLAVVSAAGPLSNVLLAILCAIVIRFASTGSFELPQLGEELVVRLILLNVSLAVFNLLPVAPLDGFGILAGVVPLSFGGAMAWLERYGPGVLLLLIFLPSFIGIDILGLVLGPPSRALLGLMQQVAGA